MNKVLDLLWAFGSVCELVRKQQMFVEFSCNVLLEKKDVDFLHQQIKKKAEHYDLEIDFLYVQPLLVIRTFPDENKEEFHNEYDFCSKPPE